VVVITTRYVRNQSYSTSHLSTCSVRDLSLARCFFLLSTIDHLQQQQAFFRVTLPRDQQYVRHVHGK